jgi:hypothetical protein
MGCSDNYVGIIAASVEYVSFAIAWDGLGEEKEFYPLFTLQWTTVV